MSEPLIDILMATYNGERFIGEQIESIQAQTYGNWHLLVSDDCSGDATLDVVRRYAAEDERIRIVSEGVRYGGAKENFFALMAKSEAPYVMFCDQDDVWLPEKIAKSLAMMRELEGEHGTDIPLLVLCDMRVVDGELNVINESFERYQGLKPQRTKLPQVLAQALGAGCCFLMNRALLLKACRCDDFTAVDMHDWWVGIAAAAFGRIAYIDEPLSLYRQHGENEVGASKFSTAAWAGKIDEMADRERAVAAQAGCFLDTFAAELDGDQKVACACLAGSMGTDRAANVLRLFASGGWKVGARKIGQLLVSVRGGVLAVVVSYRPDIERIAENLNAIAPQVNATLVYCNDAGASPDLPEVLSGQGCVWNERRENDGLSKALNRSCECAEALGARCVLLLDQDSIAGKDMVTGLLKHVNEHVALASPQIVDRNKREGAVCDDSVIPLKRSITSGSLVMLSAWRAVGGFDERMFVDWVDYDFSANLRAHGFGLVRDNGVTILHEMGRREYVFTLPTPKGGRPFYRTNHSASRLKDKARSWAIVESKYGWSRVGREERAYITAIKLRDLVLERGKLRTLRAFTEGGKEGRELMKGSGVENG